ncbi:GNAT family N-acetyltransferase [Candidatus Woesearchaeota archaeon]|nr:GNAT family N-acetyltransferase [Candidatus Woesearchaeota archaeon]
MYGTDELYFRIMEERDLEPMRILHNDPSTLYNLTDITPVNEVMQKKWFESMSQSKSSKRYVVCTKQGGSEVILGLVRFNEIDFVNRNMLVGLDIMPQFRGQGLGTKTYKLMCDYCFKELNMHKVTLYVGNFNDRGKHLYQKMGFKEEGVLKEALYRDGKYHDCIIMSLFRRDCLNNG